MSKRWIIQEIEETRSIAELTRDIDELKRPENPDWAEFRINPEGDNAPKEIFWKGRQWAVTDYGVETHRNAPYHYYLTYEAIAGHDTLDHVSDKNWADIVDFMEAVIVALQRVARGKVKL